jgi:hypothetical protein
MRWIFVRQARSSEQHSRADQLVHERKRVNSQFSGDTPNYTTKSRVHNSLVIPSNTADDVFSHAKAK